MSIVGWLYLESNELKYKRAFGRGIPYEVTKEGFWPIDPLRRRGMHSIVIELIALGADVEDLQHFISGWKLDFTLFGLKRVKFGKDGDMYFCHKNDFVDLQISNCGHGPTLVEAMADLLKQEGWHLGCGADFDDLTNVGELYVEAKHTPQ